MFIQISKREKDQAAFRFLWLTWNSIRLYLYTRSIFGAACSPTTAIFARKRSADDFASDDVVTKQLIHNAFYMDDLVHSFVNTNEASRNLLSVKEFLQKGEFNITKIVSNNIKCLVGPLNDHTVQSLHPQPVSGVLWDFQEDKHEDGYDHYNWWIQFHLAKSSVPDCFRFWLVILCSTSCRHNEYHSAGSLTNWIFLGRKFAYHIPETNSEISPRELEKGAEFYYLRMHQPTAIMAFLWWAVPKLHPLNNKAYHVLNRMPLFSAYAWVNSFTQIYALLWVLVRFGLIVQQC